MTAVSAYKMAQPAQGSGRIRIQRGSDRDHFLDEGLYTD